MPTVGQVMRKKIREERAEGKREGLLETAKRLLRERVDQKVVAKCTGLSAKELKMLQQAQQAG